MGGEGAVSTWSQPVTLIPLLAAAVGQSANQPMASQLRFIGSVSVSLSTNFIQLPEGFSGSEQQDVM